MSMQDEPNVGGRSAAEGPFARLGAEVDNLLRSLVPSDEVCQHFANARVEVLKGLRAMVDARIQRLSSDARKGVSITVE